MALLLASFLSMTQAGCALRKPRRPLTEQIMQSGELSREGNAALAQGNLEEAEKKLGKAVQLNQNEVELRLHYAEALWMRGKREEAINQLHEAAQADIPDAIQAAAIASSLAAKLLETGQCEDAIIWSRNSVRLTPRDYRGWTIRGRAYARIGERFWSIGDVKNASGAYTKARNDYYRALELAPTEERELLAELARIQMRLNQPEHALATWQNLQHLYPSDQAPTEVLVGKADALVLLGRPLDAVEYLTTASLREPNDVSLFLRRAELEIRMGRLSQADSALRQAHRLAPDHPDGRRLHEQLRTAIGHSTTTKFIK